MFMYAQTLCYLAFKRKEIWTLTRTGINFEDVMQVG